MESIGAPLRLPFPRLQMDSRGRRGDNSGFQVQTLEFSSETPPPVFLWMFFASSTRSLHDSFRFPCSFAWILVGAD